MRSSAIFQKIKIVNKNHTHMKKVGYTSEFPFAIHWWTLKKLKNQTFEKMKKMLEISSFHTCVPKNTIIWATVPEIASVSETKFFVILGHFLSCYPPAPPKNSEFWKNEKKKPSGDIIILNFCKKKHDHMMYAYSDMECDRHNCHFRPFLLFCPTIHVKN